MKEYYVNFGTGAGNCKIEGYLSDALASAVNNATYTQESIKIELDDEVVAVLPWYGVEATEDDEVMIDYGTFGFYGAWNLL